MYVSEKARKRVQVRERKRASKQDKNILEYIEQNGKAKRYTNLHSIELTEQKKKLNT